MLKPLIEKQIKEPEELGSYSRNDVIFLLKNISNSIVEKGTEDREEIIQGGGHYSEMLPIEYVPSEEYLKLYHQSMKNSTKKIADAVGRVAEEIVSSRGNKCVLVSLARAGTPFGILMKRYLSEKKGINLPHYSVSIIRGKGIDENALIYILNKHGNNIQFIDGWTGKGTITKVLEKACNDFYTKYGVQLNSDLAVVADPGNCAAIYGTKEDFLLPSACLNSTVSGLISRTVHRNDIIEEDDFHGVKYYENLKDSDLSNEFIDKITADFKESYFEQIEEKDKRKKFTGMIDVEKIKKDFDIDDTNLVKPGIGETTRVLLRRVPWKILVKDFSSENIEHILVLAKEKGVEVELYPLEAYECCGIIRPLKK